MRRSLILLLTLIGLSASVMPASTALMHLEEVRPGMLGIGRTVFGGNDIEEFKVQILGVLENVLGPRRSLILARLEGGPLETTGVIAGMSGSPVYVDGRLIGAVSYSLGRFSKAAIAGITPIREMTDAVASPAVRPPSANQARLEFPVTRETLGRTLITAFSSMKPAIEMASLGSSGLPFDEAARLGALLRPISTPLAFGGFEPEVADLLLGAFGDAGFVPSGSGSAQASSARIQATPEARLHPLQPGDAVGVGLVGGDLSLSGTGTVTYVDGDRVYAFGHELLNLGPTAFPMTRAYVHTVLPSFFASTKISTTGDIIGTFYQDRSTAIAGRLGSGPSLLPVTVTLDTSRGLQKSFRFELVNDQLLTPLLTYVSILSTLSSYEREFGAATFTVKGKATVKGHGAVSFEDVFAGNRPSIGAATYVAAPITSLLSNDFEPVEIEALDLAITSLDRPRTATLERIWLDGARPRPGQTIPLKVLLRTYRGEEITRTIPIHLPPNASGTLTLLVADGLQLTQLERRETRQTSEARGVAQMIRVLNNARKNNRLYVKLLSSEAGALVSGEHLPALPASVLAVIEADRSGTGITPLKNATLNEWQFSTEYAISGSRSLSLVVNPD